MIPTPSHMRPLSKRRTFLGLAACTGLLLFASSASSNAEYPSKPIRFIVPAPPGGGTDVVTRQIANALGSSLQWTMVIENLPGAGGNIGLERVAKAPKDGYTIGMGESSNLTVNQYIYKNIPFVIDRDLTPVSLIAKVPLVLVVSAKSPYRSVADLVTAAKSRSLMFASSGNGTLAHVVGELWKRRAGLDMIHVPYRGAAPAMTDLSGGQTDLFFASITAALPMLQAGLIRALAVTSTERAPALSDIPTMSEAGYKDIEAAVIFGVVAPTGTPATLIAKLNHEIAHSLQQPGLRKSLLELGAVPDSLGGSVETFAAVLKEDRLKWSRVVKESGATVD